jgi:hypothetical protein
MPAKPTLRPKINKKHGARNLLAPAARLTFLRFSKISLKSTVILSGAKDLSSLGEILRFAQDDGVNEHNF